MKRLFIVLMSAALLTGCEKEQVLPAKTSTASVSKQESPNLQPPTPNRSRYCYEIHYTDMSVPFIQVYYTPGSATNSPGQQYISYDVNGVNSGWIPASFPYTITDASATNIRVKESICYGSFDRSGNPITICDDTFYNLSLCEYI